MKSFDYDLIPRGKFVALTSSSIDGQSPMSIADFRDNQILIFKPTGNYIGYSTETGIRLCKGPVTMENGIWIVLEDTDVDPKFNDSYLSEDLLDFEAI